MQNKTLLIGGGLLIAVALVAGYFIFSGNKNPLPSPTPTTKVVGQETPSSSPSGEVKEVTVEGNEYSFSPASLSFKEGEKVILTFKNVGKLPHNLTIGKLGVETKTIPGGESTTTEFNASETGSFKFYCSVGNHRSLGMEGGVTIK